VVQLGAYRSADPKICNEIYNQADADNAPAALRIKAIRRG